jgi:AraC family transcriptional activator of pobA
MPKTSKNIPVLKRETYAKTYFKHEVKLPGQTTDNPLSFFEIHSRCLWTDIIEAHRLDFYLIFLVTDGAGKQSVGVNDYEVNRNTIGFIGPDAIASWKSKSKEQNGFFCAFSADFYATTWENKHFLCRLPFFQIDGKATLQLSESEMKFYETLFQLMQQEYRLGSPSSAEVIRGLLHAVLNRASADFESCQKQSPNTEASGLHLLKRFKALFMADINSIKKGQPILHKRISEYAEQLAVSPNHLSDTIKRISGRSASQLIKEQLIRQATMCLVRSEKSVAEISYLLGFEDSSYFARFYKLHTGSSPSEVRLRHTSEKYPTIRSLS